MPGGHHRSLWATCDCTQLSDVISSTMPVATSGDITVTGDATNAKLWVHEISTKTLLAELTHTRQVDATTLNNLGAGVDIDGDVIVASFGGDLDYMAVYEKPGGGWVDATDADAVLRDIVDFGGAANKLVAIDGTAAFHAVPFADLDGVLVFERPGGAWADMAANTAYLSDDENYGSYNAGADALAAGGDVVIASDEEGEYGPLGDTLTTGAIVVWVKPGGGWADATEDAALFPSTLVPASLGDSVSISGDVIVGGTLVNNNPGFEHTWDAHVFLKPGGGWSGAQLSDAILTTALLSDDSGAPAVVSINGDTIVVGDPLHDQPGENDTGRILIYLKPDGVWVDATEDAARSPCELTTDDEFGTNVAMSDAEDTAVVAAPGMSRLWFCEKNDAGKWI